jgi:hypothetical protein
MRYEIPPDLSPRERRIVEAALREYVRTTGNAPSMWALAARGDDVRKGERQAKGDPEVTWRLANSRSFFRRDSSPRAIHASR